MNIKHQARGGFTNTPDDELLVQAETVLAAMDGNANFATPEPTLVQLTAARDDYAAKLAVARKRSGPEETELKNQSRVALMTVLKRLAFYVSTTADGNLATVLSSGFQATAYPTKGHVPNTPIALKLVDGRGPVQLVFSMPKVQGAIFYEYRYGPLDAVTGEVSWGEPMFVTSSRNHLLTGLSEGKRYFVQARAGNGYGRSDWSETVSRIAQ